MERSMCCSGTQHDWRGQYAILVSSILGGQRAAVACSLNDQSVSHGGQQHEWRDQHAAVASSINGEVSAL